MKPREITVWALIPEVLLVVVILWFGIAMPPAALQGIEGACAIVSQKNVEELHETPFVKDYFSNAQSEPMRSIGE